MKESEGIVIKEYRGRYYVQTDDGLIECSLRSRLRKSLVYPESTSRRPSVDRIERLSVVDPVAVGDKVRIDLADGGRGVIKEVMPRKTKISRRGSGPSRHRLEQVMVANVDQIVAVFAAKEPMLNPRMLDRFLVIAEVEGLEAVVCINKIDLIDLEKLQERTEVYERIGYTTVYTSAIRGDGIDRLKQVLKDKISILIGPSGVGKSTLLNAIQPGLGLKVRSISRSTGKGRHTTAHLELHSLDFGGMVVDTPGLRELGLWNVTREDLPLLFPEFQKYIGLCKFPSDCAHIHEPGCAIKDAVDSGHIDERRYDSYLRIRQSL